MDSLLSQQIRRFAKTLVAYKYIKEGFEKRPVHETRPSSVTHKPVLENVHEVRQSSGKKPSNRLDRDGDGVIYEGTARERRVGDSETDNSNRSGPRRDSRFTGTTERPSMTGSSGANYNQTTHYVGGNQTRKH